LKPKDVQNEQKELYQKVSFFELTKVCVQKCYEDSRKLFIRSEDAVE
jgi:hypothetical protein